MRNRVHGFCWQEDSAEILWYSLVDTYQNYITGVRAVA